MSRALKIIALVAAIPIVIFGLITINLFVYPFQSKQPNFKDVETAFAKLQFPAEWQEISSSENRGLHGRGCDFFDSSGCFHKGKTFKVKDVTEAKDVVKELIKVQGGCADISEEAIPEGNSNTDSLTATSMKCVTADGVAYMASTSMKRGEVGVTATTSY